MTILHCDTKCGEKGIDSGECILGPAHTLKTAGGHPWTGLTAGPVRSRDSRPVGVKLPIKKTPLSCVLLVLINPEINEFCVTVFCVEFCRV